MNDVTHIGYCKSCKIKGKFTKDTPKEFINDPRCPNGHKIELTNVEKDKKFFNDIEKVIIRVLYSTRRFMSKNEIVKESEIFWIEIDEFLKSLINKEWIIVEEKGRRKRYRFNLERLIKLKKERDNKT